jgi:phenylacetate-CoA ligase
VDIAKIRTFEDFSRSVPIIRKADVFPIFSASDICQDGRIDDMRSAIVTSGTSGVFAYGLLTGADAVFQQKMIDEFFDYYFDAKHQSVLIINALAMGVSFSSSYPVIPTSVRPDIVIHLVKTFHAFYKRIVIVCDPNFAKKIVDDGSACGVSWKDMPVSFVAGGAWFPNSLAQYILSRVGRADAFLGTMGLTEIAMNIFSAPSADRPAISCKTTGK